MTIYSAQAVFSRGEVSPKLASRQDVEAFKLGLAACENFICMRTGGLRRRPGSQYVGETKSSGKVRLIPFIFSETQAYVLEVGDLYFRVYANGGRVGTVEIVTTWALADLFRLDYDQTNDVMDVCHKSYQNMRIKRTADTSWSVISVPLQGGPYLPINSSNTTLTPTIGSSVSATGGAQPAMTSNVLPSGVAAASDGSANAYKVFDGDYTNNDVIAGVPAWWSYTFGAPKIIVGYAVTVADSSANLTQAPKVWTFEAFDGVNWVALDSQAGATWSPSETKYFPLTNTAAYAAYRLFITAVDGAASALIAEIGLTESDTTAPGITLTASAIAGINVVNGVAGGFDTTDIGRVLGLYGSDARLRPFKITARTSATVITAVLQGAPLRDTKATAKWSLGAWSSISGWPAHVCTFEGRKAFARSNSLPSTVWLTKPGGYGDTLNFLTSVPRVDDDALSLTLTDINEIAWIAEGDELKIGTLSAARVMGRDNLNAPFSASNFHQKLVTRFASEPIRPELVGGSTLFVSKFGKSMREFTGSPTAGVAYDTPDITVLSDHIAALGIIQLCYQQEPDSIVWWPANDGELIGMTYEVKQSMAALHRHYLGGNGIVETACVIPGATRHEVWIVVRRTINGQTKRYIERLADIFDSRLITQPNAWCLDAALQYTGVATTSVSGLGHLEGMTVYALADGAEEGPMVVTGGVVTLPSGRPAANIIVGLTYRSRARTLPSPLSLGDGSGLNRRKKGVKVILDLLDTGSVQVGRSLTSLEETIFRLQTDPIGTALPLRTGTYTKTPEGSWGDAGAVEMVCSGALPATILSLTLAIDPEP